MRYIKIMFGMVRMLFISFFSMGGIKFYFPIRLNKNTVLSRRKKGKMIFGKHVSMNTNVHIYVTENALLSIGNFTGIGDNSIITARDRIIIGDNVMIGPNVCIYDHDHNFNNDGVMRNLGFTTAPVTIEDNVWIAAGVIILKGVTIGSGSVIAAGTIVNKNVPSNTIVYNKREMIMKKRVEEI